MIALAQAWRWPRTTGAWLGGGLVLVYLLAAVLGPWLAPFDPLAQDLDHVLRPPDARHWLGTDENGGDVLSMLLAGARLSLLIAGPTVLVSFTVGTAIGAAAGLRGGVLDALVMRVVDVLLAFPGIVLNLALVALVRRPSVGFVIVALSLNGWVGYARLARGLALALRERDHVRAARARGAGFWWLMRDHVLPLVLGPLVVQATFGFGGVVLVDASLSFLGLGPALPYGWGTLLSQGTTYLWRTSRLVAAPGVALASVVLGANLLGDSWAQRLDPRGFVRSRS